MSLDNITKAISNSVEKINEIIIKTNAMINGSGNNTNSVTLTASATTTIVTDQRCGPDAYVGLMPTTANAADALSTTYVSATKGSFTITHASNTQTDRTFRYCIVGA